VDEVVYFQAKDGVARQGQLCFLKTFSQNGIFQLNSTVIPVEIFYMHEELASQV
jgi:hypothetical protein